MPKSLLEVDIRELNASQRLDLIGQLWDSLSTENVPVPDWHVAEIERRLAEADASPESAIPWEEARARLRNLP
jgi:putative addiction module component (TIGR02574 family)